ncbi:hypothetical protein KAI46_03900, partial [bacterium]|nr:hypothetical protein [bacterium]
SLGESIADESLPAKLRERGPAILAKLVRGLLEVQRDGLNPPPEVISAVNAYQKNEDLVRQWLDDKCEIGEGFTIPARDGHKAFKEWFHDTISDTYNAPGPKKFSVELSRFLKKDRDSTGRTIYLGARLQSAF